MSRNPCSQSPGPSQPAERPGRGVGRKGGTSIPPEGEALTLDPEGARTTKFGGTTAKCSSCSSRTDGIWHGLGHA
jgi:hypothetical protein